MDIFLEKHQESILGVIEGFDRIIFKGHLTSMFPDGAFGRYLYHPDHPIRTAMPAAACTSHRSTTACRPCIFLHFMH